MASTMLHGAENLTLIRGITPNGLGFMGSGFRGRHFPKLGLVYIASEAGFTAYAMFIQHMQEAFWFYRFLSIVYV
jgi:MPBQ/MSBQ methyltransferase